MKKISVFSLFLIAAIIDCSATIAKNDDPPKSQKKNKNKIENADVPYEVVGSFQTDYPGQAPIGWYSYPYYSDVEMSDYADNDVYEEYLYPEYYEVEYIKENKPSKSLYSKSGKLIHTKSSVKEGDLPKAVSDALKTGPYKDWKLMNEKEKIEKKNPGSVVYKIKIEKNKEKQIVYYDENGKLLQARKMKTI